MKAIFLGYKLSRVALNKRFSGYNFRERKKIRKIAKIYTLMMMIGLTPVLTPDRLDQILRLAIAKSKDFLLGVLHFRVGKFIPAKVYTFKVIKGSASPLNKICQL